MTDELHFNGRVAIVTGAGSGIGKASALLLARRGAKVVLNAMPGDTSGAEDALNAIREFGGEATVIPAKIGVQSDAKTLVEHALDTYGHVDVLYSNAGRGTDANTILDEPSEAFEMMLDDHVRGPLQLARELWPHLTAQKYGRILFTSSNTAAGYFKSSPRGPEGAYSMSKAAVVTMTRNYAMAGIEHGIKVNAVMPFAYTGMAASKLDPNSPMVQWMKANLDANLVANATLYLLHEDCPVYGETFSVGGGRVARYFYAETLGHFDPELTAEKTVENWDTVMGTLSADGMLEDAFEVSQPRDEAILGLLLEKKDSPDLHKIMTSLDVANSLPLKEQNLAT